MFITFGYLTKKCLLFLIVPIAMFLRIMLFIFTKEKNIFYHGFLRFLARSINVVLWYVVVKRTSSNKIRKQDNRDTKLVDNDKEIVFRNNSDILIKDDSNGRNRFQSQYELNCNEIKKMEKISNRKKTGLLILVCFLDFVSVTCNEIVERKKSYNQSSGGLIFLTLAARLVIMAFLSYFIIKNTKMYSHHYLSIIILLLVVVLINIFSIITEKKNNNNYFSKLGLMILPELLFSIMYVCGAKYLSITKGNIYKLLFFDGIIGMISLIIFFK